MNKLLSNVSLVEIKIGGINETSFVFLNTNNGKYVGTLLCKNVIKLIYENVENDSFACFIAEVYSKKLTTEETKKALDHFKFIFNELKYNELCLLSMESGEIDIDILCESFELKQEYASTSGMM